MRRSLGQQQIPQQQQPKRQPPFDSGKYDTRYDHYNHHHHIHRALTEGEINGSEAAAGLFVPSNETLANLFVEVNALFNDDDQQSPTTGSGGVNDHESDNDDDDIHRRRLRHHNQKSKHRQSHRNHKNQNNITTTDDNDTKHGVRQPHQTEAAVSNCQLRDLCEISLLGAAQNSHVVHRMLWILANE